MPLNYRNHLEVFVVIKELRDSLAVQVWIIKDQVEISTQLDRYVVLVASKFPINSMFKIHFVRRYLGIDVVIAYVRDTLINYVS